jgi:hypothetical protein
MAKNQNMIIGIAVAAGGALLAYFAFKKSKLGATLQYGSSADAAAAQVIKSALNPSDFIQGFVDPNSIIQPLIVVGAGQGNPTWAQLQLIGVLPDITASSAGTGFIYVRQYRGIQVYGVAGWNAADTMAAANYIGTTKALPTQDVQV